MKRIISLILVTGFALAVFPQSYSSKWAPIDSRKAPAWFADAKFGIFIHWGVYSVPSFCARGYAEWYWKHYTDPEQRENYASSLKFHNETYGKDFQYFDFAPMFKAELFNPDEWADIFERSGAKYIVPTSKHHDGFCLWPSKEADEHWGRPWNAVSNGPHRDLMRDLSTAVRNKGLRFGFYYSLYEWYNPLWLQDKQQYISEHMVPQFKDVVTRYKPSVIFSDGEWELPDSAWHSVELLTWLFNESPVKDEVLVDDRWGGNTRGKHGSYFTSEYGSGMAPGVLWEENRGMGYSYGYNRVERLADYRTTRELLVMLCDIVSRGGNFLLDIGPSADGKIPVIMEERLLQMGDWLKTNGECIYGTRSWKQSYQYSQGKLPEYKEANYASDFDINKMIIPKNDGTASVEAFFTTKDKTLYCILPWFPSNGFTLKNYTLAPGAKISLVGYNVPVTGRQKGPDVQISVPSLNPLEIPPSGIYVLKIE